VTSTLLSVILASPVPRPDQHSKCSSDKVDDGFERVELVGRSRLPKLIQKLLPGTSTQPGGNTSPQSSTSTLVGPGPGEGSSNGNTSPQSTLGRPGDGSSNPPRYGRSDFRNGRSRRRNGRSNPTNGQSNPPGGGSIPHADPDSNPDQLFPLPLQRACRIIDTDHRHLPSESELSELATSDEPVAPAHS